MSDLRVFFDSVSKDAPAGTDEAAQQVGDLVRVMGVSPGEEVNWKEISRMVDQLLPQVRHINLAGAVLSLQVRSQGLAGMRNGLELLTEWLTRHWEHIYPPLDTEETKPAAIAERRLNSLANISSRAHREPMKILVSLDDVVLLDGADGGVTLQTIEKAEMAAKKGVAEDGVLDLSSLAGQFRAAASGEDAQQKLAMVRESLELLNRCSEFVRSKTGTTPTWDLLIDALKKAEHWLGLGGQTGEKSNDSVKPNLVPTGGVAGKPAVQTGFSGAVNDRAAARRALEAVCTYYDQSEPSSPIPLVIRRLLRFMDADFLKLITEFAPAGLDELLKVVGKEEKPPE
jgi:type VI secretion system protein ImpA